MTRCSTPWIPGVFLAAAIVALAAAGCNATGVPPAGQEGQKTLQAIATPEALPTTDREDSPISPETAPSTPLVVRLRMDRAPGTNQEATVVLDVQAYWDAPGTTAEIELPPEAQLLSGELNWEGDVKVNQPVQLAVTIVFTREGEHTIRGSALRPVDDGMVWGDADHIYLTVKEQSGQFGFESGGDSKQTTGGSR